LIGSSHLSKIWREVELRKVTLFVCNCVDEVGIPAVPARLCQMADRCFHQRNCAMSAAFIGTNLAEPVFQVLYGTMVFSGELVLNG
jgi:hypothetical protein